MNPRIACIIAALAIPIAGTAATARADVHVGIEMGRSLAGFPGLGARVDLGPVQIEGLVAGQLTTTEHVPRDVEGAIRAMVPLARWQDGWVGVMAGIDGYDRDTTNLNGDFTHPQWAVEGGVHVEWFALPALSLGLEVGAVHIVNHVLPDATATSNALGAGTLSGGGTITFWF